MPSILHRGNGNFSAICSPLRYRKSRTPRKSVLPQHRPAVFYLIRKYQNSPEQVRESGMQNKNVFA